MQWTFKRLKFIILRQNNGAKVLIGNVTWKIILFLFCQPPILGYWKAKKKIGRLFSSVTLQWTLALWNETQRAWRLRSCTTWCSHNAASIYSSGSQSIWNIIFLRWNESNPVSFPPSRLYQVYFLQDDDVQPHIVTSEHGKRGSETFECKIEISTCE